MIKLALNNHEVELSSIGDAILPLVTIKNILGETPKFQLLKSDGRSHPKQEELTYIVSNHFYSRASSPEKDEMIDNLSPYEIISDGEKIKTILPNKTESEINKTIQTLYLLGY